VFSVGGSPGSAPTVNPQIGMEKPVLVAEEPLRAELKSFLDAVRTGSKPLVSLEDGRRALAVALEIVDAIHAHSESVDLERIGAR
jgi:predicted dehydrogenase